MVLALETILVCTRLLGFFLRKKATMKTPPKKKGPNISCTTTDGNFVGKHVKILEKRSPWTKFLLNLTKRKRGKKNPTVVAGKLARNVAVFTNLWCSSFDASHPVTARSLPCHDPPDRCSTLHTPHSTGDTRVDRHETKSRSKKLRRRRGDVVWAGTEKLCQ